MFVQFLYCCKLDTHVTARYEAVSTHVVGYTRFLILPRCVSDEADTSLAMTGLLFREAASYLAVREKGTVLRPLKSATPFFRRR